MSAFISAERVGVEGSGWGVGCMWQCLVLGVLKLCPHQPPRTISRLTAVVLGESAMPFSARANNTGPHLHY